MHVVSDELSRGHFLGRDRPLNLALKGVCVRGSSLFLVIP
jgi:hypothetical protein